MATQFTQTLTCVSRSPYAVENARELLSSYLPIYDSYHSQKETIAYTIVTLYIGAGSTFFFQAPFWRDYSSIQMLGIATVLGSCAVLAFAFVSRQLRLCRTAGYVYDICSSLLTTWITREPEPGDLDPELFPKKPRRPLLSGLTWPRVLEQQLERRLEEEPFTWAPRIVSYLVMGLWTIFVVLKICASWNATAPWLRQLYL